MTANREDLQAARDYLQRESHKLDEAIRGILARVEQTVFVSFTVVAAAATIVLADHHWAVAFGLPWVGGLLAAVALTSLNEMFALAAQKSLVDDQIEKLLLRMEPKIRVVGWERGAAKFTRFSLPQLLMVLGAVIVGVSTCVGSLLLAWSKFPHQHPWVAWNALGFGVFVTLECVALWRLLTVYERARNHLTRLPNI